MKIKLLLPIIIITLIIFLLPQQTDAYSGDHPLTYLASYQGNVDVAIDVRSPNGCYQSGSGTFSITGIPSGATILDAWFELAGNGNGGTPYQLATSFGFQGSLPTKTADEFDYVPSGWHGTLYRHNVTARVLGNGGYAYSFSGSSYVCGVALVVVYEHASLPLQAITINDGVDVVSGSTTSTNISAPMSGFGELYVWTTLDESGRCCEQLLFNGNTIGSGNIFNNNRGRYTSLYSRSNLNVVGTNQIAFRDGGDIYSANMAILVSPWQAPSTMIWDGGGVDDNWSTAANWDNDTIPTAIDTVQFDITSSKNAFVDSAFSGEVANVVIDSAYTGNVTFGRSFAVTGDYQQSGGTVIIDPFYPFTVDGTFTHTGGTLQEAKDASGGITNFLQIQGSGGIVYRGVDLDATSTGNSLGYTTVVIKAVDTANGEYCTNTGASSPRYAGRCFTITPTTNLPAYVKLWALTSEIYGSTNPGAFHYSGGTWYPLPSITTGIMNDYTWVNGFAPNFSPFLITEVDGSAPTAVSLQSITTTTSQPMIVIAGILLFMLSVAMGGMWIRHHK